MPLLRHRYLACWERLELEGIQVVDPVDASSANLHVGFLNMMPDRAFKATERQFFRLLAAGANDDWVMIHPFTIAGLPREAEVARYVSAVYDSFETIQQIKLDGLVLTGANPGQSEITNETFWPYFEQVVQWANVCVPCVFCSCLASHAILKIFYGIERIRCQPDKRWGVYSHRVTQNLHPLMVAMPDRYEEPRSHVFEMTARQIEPHGVQVLTASADADFGVAVSEDGSKWVFLQGHPEYDAVSLLKEYKREINRYRIEDRDSYPDFPLNYLPAAARPILNGYRSEIVRARQQKLDPPEFPESDILPLIVNTWGNHAKILFHNWIRLVAAQKDRVDSAPAVTGTA